MLPLAGKFFCCTAITAKRREQIESRVKELGGSYSLDLMSHTNFLIVGDTQTPKYTYCIKNRFDITFLKPTAIDLYYEDVQNGKSSSIEDYSLPMFHDFNFCIAHIKSDEIFDTGDISVLEIKDYITKNGGKYTDSLTINHNMVITNVASGKRYDKAIEWKIPVVHPIFIVNSIKRKAQVDLREYTLDKYPNFPVDKPQAKAPKIRKNVEVWNSIMNKRTHSELTIPEKTETHAEKSLIFSSTTFKLHSFTPEQLRILTKIIQQHGGVVNSDEEADYVLVPFGKEPDIPGNVRTEWLVERSIYYKKLLDDEWSYPIPPVIPQSPSCVSLSGFKGIEYLHLTKLCEHLGLEVSDKFHNKIDLLVININIFGKKLPQNLFYNELVKCAFNSISYISTKNKIVAAKNWKVPIVTLNYLFETARGKEYPSLKDLRWCLFYLPRERDESQDSESLKLPSPKKIKKRFGRLVTSLKVELDLKPQTLEREVIDDLDFDLEIGYDKRRKLE